MAGFILPPIMNVGRVPLTITYAAHAEYGAAPWTTHTYSSTAIGTAAADRRVIVGVSLNTNSSFATFHTVSTLTVGGVSATKFFAANSTAAAGYYERLEFWYADVPTGTTADIVVTGDGEFTRGGIGVWATENRATLDDTLTSTANPMTGSLDVAKGGVALGLTMIDGNNTMTWTNLTERYDADTAAGIFHSGADAASATAQTLTITATPSVSGTERVMAAISLAP